MVNRPSHIRSNYEGYSERMKVRKERRAKMLIEAKRSPRLFQNSDNIQIIGKVEKKTFFENESFKIVKAMSLALSILTLCYYGCTEYNILHNGQILRFPSRKTVVTFSFGYSVNHSIISAVATSSMLVYSIIMKRPQFSLPFIGFFLADLVCDFCDVVIAIWYLFQYLQIQTALLYAAGLVLLILTELWTWLGAVQLYEHRKFKALDDDNKRQSSGNQ